MTIILRRIDVFENDLADFLFYARPRGKMERKNGPQRNCIRQSLNLSSITSAEYEAQRCNDIPSERIFRHDASHLPERAAT